MKVLLDTSTLIAAMLSDHVHHSESQTWLARAKAKAFEFVVSGHTIAEVFSVLTRLPRNPRIMPADAWQLLHDNVLVSADVVTLSGADYGSLVAELSRLGLGGGLVYDAIIAKVAQLSQVDYLVTLNDADFIKVWPSGGSRIVSPISLPPPSP